MSINQEDFDEAMKDAELASCPDGKPHVYVERLKFVNRGCIYEIGECERCREVTWGWYDSTDRPVKVGKDGRIKP